jgi:hypothetical protein
MLPLDPELDPLVELDELDAPAPEPLVATEPEAAPPEPDGPLDPDVPAPVPAPPEPFEPVEGLELPQPTATATATPTLSPRRGGEPRRSSGVSIFIGTLSRLEPVHVPRGVHEHRRVAP